MQDKSRLMRWGERSLRILVVGNWLFAGAALLCLAGSFAAQDMLVAQLVRKYGADMPVMTIVWQLRALLVLGAVSAWPIGRCLTLLADLVASVRAGMPFDPGNVGRVTAIGWALLAIQCLDVTGSVLTALIARTGADVAGWQPSVAGWISVPIAFVLARVFAAGVRMRDDLEGTV